MARKKTITRDQILTAAYNLVIEEGFNHFTARAIANSIGCSTQPIYLEFENMQDLKDSVLAAMKEMLTVKMSRRYTDDPVIDLSLAYIYFAIENPAVYRAAFIEDHFGVDTMRDFTLQTIRKRLESSDAPNTMTEDDLTNTITAVWIVATGLATLTASGFINPSQDQMIALLKSIITDFTENKRFCETADASPMLAKLATQS